MRALAFAEKWSRTGPDRSLSLRRSCNLEVSSGFSCYRISLSTLWESTPQGRRGNEIALNGSLHIKQIVSFGAVVAGSGICRTDLLWNEFKRVILEDRIDGGRRPLSEQWVDSPCERWLEHRLLRCFKRHRKECGHCKEK